MTTRARFTKVMNFERPDDRLPIIEWAPWWELTLARWIEEGLPAQIGWGDLIEYFDLEDLCCIGAMAIGPGCPTPARHGAGIITDTASYEAIRPYLFQERAIETLLEAAHHLQARHAQGEIIIRTWLDGFFWLPRMLFGIENHLYAFYDMPELMHRINREMTAFHLQAIERLCTVLVPEMACIAEDMSYNHGPMLSHACFQEFLQPYYLQIVPALHAHGIKVFVDSDGDVAPLLPWLLEVGVDGIMPLERQSGVDVAQLRARYPRLLMLGGYNKLVMSHGEAAMRAEFERLLPVMQSGGFVPSVDHQTPPEVSLSHYQIYRRLLSEYAERAVSGLTPAGA